MKTKFIFLCLAVMTGVFLLSGCGPEYQTVYSYTPPHSWRGKKCVNRCLTKRTYCENTCRSQAQTCRTEAKLEALPAYLHYDHEQRNAGNPDYETVGDFADYSGCSDHCGCQSTYRACFENCGGSVFASTQCVAFCPKPTGLK
ncbi:MAG: hypothetical protein COY58_05555 [Gammaproteobacteria bacterium CG_4_10_14_0_8_um_filter_38_16]|nr:MAG: hypothetical protein COY58_05555 [Gammaproteobacteria bacterium CG_4_10_14_0_8_um_filter_38_16]PJA04357.1 MAG: hypothetical protein COX72_00165 [Gammaproteobacteria bacterium CG_4_10_14_0_2_um_filter_38_22]PJB09546.1 MAG: hypothetical protein CO120_09555 [Gammaproteobacteria bacterium CG_4_9_14_3_um_filter_38_9]